MKALEIILLLTGFFTLISCASFGDNKSDNLIPVSNFDVAKYLGKWYEIARMPFSFEKDLVNVTATYSLRKDGKIRVQNEGYKKSPTGKHKTAIGKAKFAGDKTKGHLRVSFFLFFYSDYTIIDLDKDYRYALVASSHKYLWILSREPHLEKDIIDHLLQKAQSLGFDTNRLIFTPQNW